MKNYQQTLVSFYDFMAQQHPELNQVVLNRHKANLSKIIQESHNNTVVYGPFKGLKFTEESHWGDSDKGSMILGLYEKEILNELSNIPKEYEIFIDLGAADGYYGIGVLINDLFKKSYCYEIVDKGRDIMAKTAALNLVNTSVEVRGEATQRIVSEIPQEEIDKSVLFVDIEGGEFHFFNDVIFNSFSKAIIIVELHDFFYSDGNSKMNELLRRSRLTHTHQFIRMGARDLSMYPE